MKKFFLGFVLVALLTLSFAPNITLAATAGSDTPTSGGGACPPPKNIGELFQMAICILTRFVVPFLFALALVMFLVGVVKYVRAGDSEEAREAGRGLMLFGIIALFVMTAVWGFVGILYRSFFGEGDLSMPSLPKQSAPFQ
jgi:hypothetical protein